MGKESFKYYCIRCGRQFESNEPDSVLCSECISETNIKKVTDNKLENKKEKISKSEEEASLWKVGDCILDTYDVTDVLGEGGMGRVYKVHHRGWNIDLAVKTPLPNIYESEEGRKSFVREAETWVNLGLHPNIVCCYYVRVIEGIPRVFAEYVEGGSLIDWIEKEWLYQGDKNKVMERILDIAIQTARGLEYSHRQGMVHQDVKSSNIMVSLEGNAKVTDFGLSKVKISSVEEGMLDTDDIMVSRGGMTPAYCSPEQASGERLTIRTDIWSFAVTVLEMFNGGVTWLSGVAAPGALKYYVENQEQSSRIPGMPRRLAELLKKCFEYSPSMRPGSMREVEEILLEVFKEETGKPYFRRVPQQADLRAAGLNNRGISCLDLGKEEEAEKCWQEALKFDPLHVEAAFNRSYSEWKHGKLSGQNFIVNMKSLENSSGREEDLKRLLAWIYLEQGDEAALKELNTGDIKDEALQKLLKKGNQPNGRLKRIFEGHQDYVESARFTPDGQYVLSCGWDVTVRLWKTEDGSEIACFKGHNLPVRDVCFSRAGLLYFCSAGSDGTIRLWQLGASKTAKKVFYGHTGDIFSLSMAMEGPSYLASASADKTIIVWDLIKGAMFTRLTGHTDDVNSVYFSPDGHSILSGSSDKTIRLWEIASGKEVRQFRGHTDIVVSVCFSSDGLYAASGSFDTTVRLWETVSGKEIRCFKGHVDKVISVAFSPDGRFIASGSLDETIRLWEVGSGRELRCFEGHSGCVLSVDFSKDGKYIVSASQDSTIRLWEVFYPEIHWQGRHPYPMISRVREVGKASNEQETYMKLLDEIKKHEASGNYKRAHDIIRKAQCIDGYERNQKLLDMLAAFALKGKAIRKGVRGLWLDKMLAGNRSFVDFIDVSPDDKYLLSGSWGPYDLDNSIRLWNLEEGLEVRTLVEGGESIISLSFSPDGKFAMSGSSDGVIRIWELSTGKEVRSFKLTVSGVESACFSPTGRSLAAAGQGFVVLWDLLAEKQLRLLRILKKSNIDVSFSHNGDFLLITDVSNSVALWDMEKGDTKKHITVKGELFKLCVLSPDDKKIAVTDQNSWIRIWDVEENKQVCLITLSEEKVNSLCLSPDGLYIVSGNSDGTIGMWDMNGRETCKLKAHQGSIRCLCFTRDGRRILSGGTDNLIRILQIDWEWEFK